MACATLSVTDEGHWAVEAQSVPVNSEQKALDQFDLVRLR